MPSKWMLLLATAGCGTSIAVTRLNPAPRPMLPRPAASVELFTSGPPKDRAYIDVAYMEAEQDSAYSFDGTPEFFAYLRARAGEMGCDAVVVGHPTNAVSLGIDLKTPLNVKGLVATCIVYSDAPPAYATVPPPPPPPVPPAPKP